MLYKDISNGDLRGTVKEKSEFVSLNIFKYTSQDHQLDMGIHVAPQDKVGSSTSPIVLKRSSRIVRALDRYSPSNYILLTNRGETKSHKEILQDGNSSKCELVMKNEIGSSHRQLFIGID